MNVRVKQLDSNADQGTPGKSALPMEDNEACAATMDQPLSGSNNPDTPNPDTPGLSLATLPYCLIALLLLATATAKLWMLLTDPFADVRVGIPREILWLSVAFELWLAYANFRMRDRSTLAFVDTIVFSSFAIIASVRWLLGYGTCGCSGSLELPAWIFILIDVVIVRGNNRGQEIKGVRLLFGDFGRL